MKNAARTRPAGANGFTLIEMLAVILIIAILVAVLVVNLRDAVVSVNVSTTKQLLDELGAAANEYEVDNGRYPPSSFESGQDVGNDGTNVGIEAFVVAMWSKKYEAGGKLKDVRDKLVNTDHDSSPKQLTDFGTRELLEIPDQWGNPIAYIEKSDYPAQNRRYTTLEAEGEKDQEQESVPVAFKNKQTGQYFSPQAYQFISAGPDGRFGTDDDVTTFKRD